MTHTPTGTRVRHGSQHRKQIGRDRCQVKTSHLGLVKSMTDQRRYRHGHGTRSGWSRRLRHRHDHQRGRVRTASTASTACRPATRPTSRLCRGPGQ